MYLESVASESSQQHKSGSSCKKSIRTSRWGASCLMTTRKAMRHRAGALGLPGKYSTRWGADFTEFGSISIRIEAVPGSSAHANAHECARTILPGPPSANNFCCEFCVFSGIGLDHLVSYWDRPYSSLSLATWGYRKDRITPWLLTAAQACVAPFELEIAQEIERLWLLER